MTTPATQALLPVTPEDRAAAAELMVSFRVGGDASCISAKQSLRELERAILDGDCREYIDGVIAARAAHLKGPKP